MYPFTPGMSDSSSKGRLPSSEIGNTSQVDVFTPAKDLNQFPAFVQEVHPTAVTAVLAPRRSAVFSSWMVACHEKRNN